MFDLFKNTKKDKGFTLIELIVSISLFTVVSLIGVGALLSIVEANRKTQSLKVVVNNIAFGLENLSKNMRVGTTYHCNTGPSVPVGFDQSRNCASGGDLIAFESSTGNPSDSSDQVIYRFDSSDSMVERSTDGGSTFLPITGSDVEITRFTVYVFGAPSSDGLHPRALILVGGNVNLGKNAVTEFNIQTTVSQRGLDT